MYRITNINTGTNLGAVDKVVYIKIGESGDSFISLVLQCADEQAVDDSLLFGDQRSAVELRHNHRVHSLDFVVASQIVGHAVQRAISPTCSGWWSWAALSSPIRPTAASAVSTLPRRLRKSTLRPRPQSWRCEQPQWHYPPRPSRPYRQRSATHWQVTR